jgi:hypothetical protein
MNKDAPSYFPPELFLENTQKEFEFLEREYGFHQVEKDVYYGATMYANDTTAVSISYDFREGEPAVYLIQKDDAYVNGIPGYLEMPQNWIPVEFIVMSRLKNGKDLPQKPFDVNEVNKYYAELIKEYATCVLEGDFSVFQDARELINQRIASS